MSYKETLDGYELYYRNGVFAESKYDTLEIYESLEQASKILSIMLPEDFGMLKPWLTHIFVIFVSKLSAGAREKIADIISKADIGEMSTVIYNLERTLEEKFQKRKV
jgi:hypothetical protein